MTPDEVDDLLEYGQLYFGGIKINDVFYTWEDLENGLESR